MYRLKMMLESKIHELQNVNQIANAAHKQLDELQKRLSITQAELDRAHREKRNTHELLVETKESCSNKDRRNCCLKNSASSEKYLNLSLRNYGVVLADYEHSGYESLPGGGHPERELLTGSSGGGGGAARSKETRAGGE